MTEQIKAVEQIKGIEFAGNSQTRCAFLLLLDTSGSMHGKPILQLNEGLQLFAKDLIGDSMAAKSVDIGIIPFGSIATVLQPFINASQFAPPTLTPGGSTSMGSAIELGCQMIKDRKAEYRQNGITYFRPIIWLITDGGPTDNITNAIHLVHEGEDKEKFSFFAVGVEGADMGVLAQISKRAPVMLKGLDFKAMFAWLKATLVAVSGSRPDQTVPLQPLGWTTT